jgi:hypothetical protein
MSTKENKMTKEETRTVFDLIDKYGKREILTLVAAAALEHAGR